MSCCLGFRRPGAVIACHGFLSFAYLLDFVHASPCLARDSFPATSSHSCGAERHSCLVYRSHVPRLPACVACSVAALEQRSTQFKKSLVYKPVLSSSSASANSATSATALS